jgi:hypothetical protein
VHRDLFLGNPEGKNPEEDLCWRIILKWILEKRIGMWTGFIWLRIETSGGLF